MPTYRYVAVGPDGSEIKDALEAPSEDALRNQLLMRNLEVKSRQAEEEVHRARAHAAARPASKRSCTSRARWPRSCAPVSRSPKRSRSSRKARATSASGRSWRACASRSTTVCRSPTRSPSTPRVFPPYYIGILKSAELTGQLDVSLEQLSQYMERDLDSRSKIKAAMIYPAVIFGMSILTVVILAVWVHAQVREVLQQPPGRSCRCPRCCSSRCRTLAQKLWFVWTALFVAGRRRALVDAQVGQGPHGPRPHVPARPAGQGRRAVRGHRARRAGSSAPW